MRSRGKHGLHFGRGLTILCLVLLAGAIAMAPGLVRLLLLEGRNILNAQTKDGLPPGPIRDDGPPVSPRQLDRNPPHQPRADPDQLASRPLNLKVTHLTSDDGLSNIRINSILQDRRGFMWIATEDGLNRYDGNTFVVYKNNPADPNTVSASFIMSLIEDDHGYLWIGTLGGGLDKFDPTTERFTHYRNNPDNPNSISGNEVKSLAKDSRGYLWLGTVDDGLNSFDPATGTFTRYRNDSQGQFLGAVNSILEDRQREIWFAGPRGLFHVSPHTGQITHLPTTIDGLGVDHIHEDKAGNFWMLAYNPVARLVKYDRQAERFTAYSFGKGAVGIPFSNILEDGQNGLWVASSLGLYRFNLQTEQFTDRFQHDESNPDSLNDSSVSFIYRDRAGVLWVGTQTWGLNLFNTLHEQFASYRHRPGNPASLLPGAVTALHQDRDGILWAGLFPRALDRLDRKTGQIAHYLPGSGNQNALGKGSNLVGIYRDTQGFLWLGGWGVLDRFDERSGQFKHYRHKPGDPNSLISDEINCVYQDRSGRLWVAQNGGLSRFDPATEKFANYRNHPADPTSLGISNVSAIYQDRSGTLWLGTWTGTLSRFYDKTNTFVNLRSDAHDRRKLSDGRIQAIHEDRAGTLWLGTTDGLFRYNREDQTFAHYTENQGLPSSVIQCILDDRFGKLWLSTKKGISRFDPETGAFRNYDASDGLQSNDFAFNSCYEDSQSGEMLFGGSNGITAFFPENIRDNPYVPPVVLTSFKVFNKPVPIGPRSVLTRAIPFVDSLTLPHRDNVFSLEFAALSYANSQKNRYRYMLENFDRGWNEVNSKQRLATYTNLDPGKYVFRVQGSNSDGVWNEKGISLTIFITPAWYQTVWFRILCAACFCALLWAVYQIRVRQLQVQEAKFREAVESMPAMAFVVGPDGHRQFVNKRWVDYTGVSVEEASGMRLEDVVHPDDANGVAERWRAALAAGQPIEYETRLRRGTDASYRWFLTQAVPVRDKRGGVVKWCGVSTDIQDRKVAEELQAELAHVNRISTLGELAASISHELKQPIAATMLNASTGKRWLNRDVPDVGMVCNVLDRILQDSRRATEVIDRLRALYKKSPAKRELLAVNDVIFEMAGMLRSEAMHRGVSVRTALANDLPMTVADRIQVQQVLMNLMLNGIEAMKDTGGDLTIRSQRDEEGRILVSVQDTGVGLPAGAADRIFEAFFTTKAQGSGMGLAISRSIVEGHGGRIWATGNGGHGATFYFTLPAAQQEANDPANAI